MSDNRHLGIGVSALRGFSLFANFFLIILAYYLIKPASRSLFLEHFAAQQLPYVWISSAILLGALMPFYSRLVGSVERRHLVFICCGVFSLILAVFGHLLSAEGTSAWQAFSFYMFVDILSVVLVEQFWSLTNSAFVSENGSRWYGLVGSGGLLGGLVGGQLATWLVKSTPLQTTDLLYVSAIIIGCIAALTALLSRNNLYDEQVPAGHTKIPATVVSLAGLLRSRYLLLVTTTILFAQIVEPIVEYQFMSFVEVNYAERDLRTAYLSNFLSMLSMVALAVNLLLTPLVLRYFGAVAGIVVQPLLVLMSSLVFQANASLGTAAVLKISDRASSYSINRAAKEMLYVPVAPTVIYRAKAWIDMFGYRLFKIVGSVLILAMTQWFDLNWGPLTFSWIVIPVCIGWIAVGLAIKPDYEELRDSERERLAPAA